MKLGICCVYFYGADSEWLLDLQLKYIEGTLAGYDYTIYAAANRLRPELRHILERTPRLEIVPLPSFNGDGSLEHAFYLDLLLRHAAEEGCTHVVALDADSFPVLPDWPKLLLRRMNGARFAAVLRSENLDTHLPHPSGIFMARSFLLDHAPRMLPPEEEMLDFLKETGQRADTGVGYGYALWKSQEPWLALKRSNRRNFHFLMAGIYGDIFFHLGASSRAPWFRRDELRKPSLLIAHTLGKFPVSRRLQKFIYKRYVASNRRILMRITNELRSSPARFLSTLQ